MPPDHPQTSSVAAPPFFSVIIPVYNRSESISTAIDSVLAQTCSDYETIVVDDGSTDSTPERLASYGNRIRVCRQVNSGGGPARQFGISQARGEYVAFLDSDDVWSPWTLEIYLRVIKDLGSPSILLGKASHTDHDPQDVAKHPGSVRYAVHPDFLASAPEYHWYGFSVIVARRSCIPAGGALPDSRVAAQDLFFLLMMGIQPGFVSVESPPTAIYRRHVGSISANPLAVADAMWNLIDYEQRGLFAGGSDRSEARRTLICRSVRSASATLLRAGMPYPALSLYRATWHWQAANARWKYLFGFPIACLTGMAMNRAKVAWGIGNRIPKCRGGQ